MLQGPLAPLPLAAWVTVVAAVAAMAAPEQCTSEMSKIKDLLEVSCEDKGLTSVPPGLPGDTGILLLDHNRLAQVALASFQHLPQLSKLDLSNNSLVVLETGATLPKLQELLLSDNGLESLPAFSGLPALTVLDLGHNRLSRLPEGGFRALERLERLFLQANQLQTLPGAAFEGLEKLLELDLSDNRLEALPPMLVAELPNLEILYLERNRLERLPDGFFSEEAVYIYIYLVGNPWLCDCRLLYLHEWITNNSHAVYTRVNVVQNGVEKENTENKFWEVLCQEPPEWKDLPVVNFTAVGCWKRRADGQEEKDDGGGAAEDTLASSPAPFPPTCTAPLPPASPSLAAPSHSSSTAVGPTGATLTTTNTSAVRPKTTHSPTTTSSAPLTTFNGLGTTAATAPFVPSPTGATVGTLPATSDDPMSPGPSTAHVQPRRVPTPTVASSTPFTPSPTAWTLSAPLPASTAPRPTTAAGHPSSTAALLPSTPTPARSPPGISAPASPDLSPPPAPRPSAPCLCPAPPVRVLGVAARKGSTADWLAGYCCLLRLALYLACLALVAMPTLVVLCSLGQLYLGWYRLALQGPPGSRLAGTRQWQKASPKEWQPKFAEAPYCTTGPRIYRVCKRFQVAPSRHVTWLLVSLPGSAGKRAPVQARLSSYSLDGGKATLGAVRVKYATASL